MNPPCLRLAVLCGLAWSAAAVAQTPAVTVDPAAVTLATLKPTDNVDSLVARVINQAAG